MTRVLIDGKELEFGDDERLNAIEAASRAGVEIPRFCWHPGLSVVASCRMCMIETGRVDFETGDVSMVPKLVPACQTPVADGTVIVTDSQKILDARAMVEEDLLLNHPIDCPTCDKAGECSLQDYHFEHGQAERRADVRPFTSRRRPVGETVTLFVDRCVMCTRCVRFTREITGTSELMVSGRGSTEEIDIFPGFPLDNKMSGNVVDICPVGALGDVDFLYRQRVWFMKNRPHVCAGCSAGCSIFIDENQDQIHRLRPRENEHVNGWWMCDEGRYGYKHVHSENRVTTPSRQNDEGVEVVEWSDLLSELDGKLKTSGRLAAVLSPHLTVEEAYLLATYIRSIDAAAVLACGPIQKFGEDESFPGGFTIRSEKCPNRRGVESVIVGLDGETTSWNDLLEQAGQGEFGAVWITGGYKQNWCEQATADQLRETGLLIVQDSFASPAWNVADYRLPGATFAERAGSYVNHAGRLQAFDWAVRPPAGVQLEGQTYWRLLQRKGMYQAADVRAEIANKIAYFAAASGVVPDTGVELTGDVLAVEETLS